MTHSRDTHIVLIVWSILLLQLSWATDVEPVNAVLSDAPWYPTDEAQVRDKGLFSIRVRMRWFVGTHHERLSGSAFEKKDSVSTT